MSNAPYSQDHSWRSLYIAAIFEPDLNEIPRRITEAEQEIIQRARRLFRDAESNIEEVQALDSAMCTLQVLRNTLKTRAGKPSAFTSHLGGKGPMRRKSQKPNCATNDCFPVSQLPNLKAFYLLNDLLISQQVSCRRSVSQTHRLSL